jgi:hypothetical protein
VRTLVYQLAPEGPPGWILACLKSLRRWAGAEGFAYRLYGDEVFELVEPALAAKTGGRLQMLTDLARLTLARDLLEREGWERVIYADADFLVWRAEALAPLASERGAAFGQEFWVQREGAKLKLHRNVHNAFMLFERGGSVLPFYEEIARSLLARLEGGVLPQFLGPKLLSALQGPAAFALLPQAGALSPDVAADILGEGDGRALARMRESLPAPLGGANLCASLLEEKRAERLVERLLAAAPA